MLQVRFAILGIYIFFLHLREETWILCYIWLYLFTAGNVTSEEAELLVQHIEESLFKGPGAPSKPLFPSQHVEERIIRLDSGTSHYYPVEGLSEKNENSALLHYIQVNLQNTLSFMASPFNFRVHVIPSCGYNCFIIVLILLLFISFFFLIWLCKELKTGN